MSVPLQHPTLPVNLVSSLLLLLAVTVSLWYWSTRRNLTEARLHIAFGGLVGAFVGAKIFYFIAEGPIWWNDPLFWMRMLAGKTILGGLIGGWIGVEGAKFAAHESRVMGDQFARIIPIGIAIGRLGCWSYGCCPGRPLVEVTTERWTSWLAGLGLTTWPAPLVEIAFQLAFWMSCIISKDVRWLKGQQFHVYLIAYGVFRAFHEYFRGTVRYEGVEVSPYSAIAILVACGGLVGFVRRRANRINVSTASPA